MSISESSSNDELVTTIYVNGFPDDFKEREFQNLFAFAKGFEGCSLRIPVAESDPSNSPLLRCFNNVPRGQILGFVKFKTLPDAMEACAVLNGRVVDAERGCMLKAELAKKNLVLGQLRSSRSAFSYFSSDCKENLFGPNLTRRSSISGTSLANGTSGNYDASFQTNPRSLNLTVPGNPIPISVAAPSSLLREQQFVLFDNAKTGGNFLNNGLARNLSNFFTNINISPSSSLVTSGGMFSYYTENPPCNTLYVGNLPPTASEMELRSIFSVVSGFRRLSFKTKLGGTPMCFVEFEDINTATNAMEALYGTMLSNSTKGGIRLSYSKNPLGVRSCPPVSSYIGTSLYADLFSPLSDLQTCDHIQAGFNFSTVLETPITPNSQ